MNEQIDPVENLKNWANLHVQNTEREITKTLFRTLLETTHKIDLLSRALLILVGASFALVIPNLSGVAEIVPPSSIRLFLLLLIISALCGVAQKVASSLVEMRMDMAVAIERELIEHLQKAEIEEKSIREAADYWGTPVSTEIDMKRIISTFSATFPKWLQRRTMKKAEAGSKDPLDGFKDASKEYWRQSVWFALQIVFTLSAFAAISLNMNG